MVLGFVGLQTCFSGILKDVGYVGYVIQVYVLTVCPHYQRLLCVGGSFFVSPRFFGILVGP